MWNPLHDWRRTRHTAPGLASIMRERKRADERESMQMRVKETQSAMDRINWEEKQCRYSNEAAKPHAKGGVEGEGGEEEENSSPFVRCQISSVVNHIKEEEEEKERIMNERKDRARLNREKKQALEEERHRQEEQHRRHIRQSHQVSSIDTLGMDAWRKRDTRRTSSNNQHDSVERRTIADSMRMPKAVLPLDNPAPASCDSLLIAALRQSKKVEAEEGNAL